MAEVYSTNIFRNCLFFNLLYDVYNLLNLLDLGYFHSLSSYNYFNILHFSLSGHSLSSFLLFITNFFIYFFFVHNFLLCLSLYFRGLEEERVLNHTSLVLSCRYELIIYYFYLVENIHEVVNYFVNQNLFECCNFAVSFILFRNVLHETYYLIFFIINCLGQ